MIAASLARIRSGKFARKAASFFYSHYFASAVGLFVLLCYTFRLDAVAHAVLAALTVLALLFCDDATPCIPILLLSVAARSMARRYGGTGVEVRVVKTVGEILVGIAFLYHIWVTGAYRRFWQWGRLGVPTAVLAFALLTCGLGFSQFSRGSLAEALKRIEYMCLLFVLLRMTVRWTTESTRYLAYTCTVAGLVLGITLCETYLLYKPFIDSGYNKDLVLTGWGMSNTIGPLIFVNIPLTLYAAYTEKRHAWLYFAAATCMLLCVVLTMCRTALLFGAPIFALCVAFLCVKAQRRKQIWLCTLALLALVIFVLCFGKTRELLDFYLHSKFDDHGRWEIYRLGLQLFEDHPLFGVGLKYVYTVPGVSYWFHNTVIEFMAAGGTVGIFCYAFYRAYTVRLYTRKLSVDRFFLGAVLLAIVTMSLLDNAIFHANMEKYMAVVLVFSERDYDHCVWFADCPPPCKTKPLYLYQ